MDRRSFVASAGAVAAASLAGCPARFRSDDTETPAYRLELTVQNDHDRPYDVAVDVRDDDAPVFEQSFRLGPGEGRGLADDFAAGEYTITVELADRSRLRSFWNTDQCSRYRVWTVVAADGRVTNSVACQAAGSEPPVDGAPSTAN